MCSTMCVHALGQCYIMHLHVGAMPSAAARGSVCQRGASVPTSTQVVRSLPASTLASTRTPRSEEVLGADEILQDVGLVIGRRIAHRVVARPRQALEQQQAVAVAVAVRQPRLVDSAAIRRHLMRRKKEAQDTTFLSILFAS